MYFCFVLLFFFFSGLKVSNHVLPFFHSRFLIGWVLLWILKSPPTNPVLQVILMIHFLYKFLTVSFLIAHDFALTRGNHIGSFGKSYCIVSSGILLKSCVVLDFTRILRNVSSDLTCGYEATKWNRQMFLGEFLNLGNFSYSLPSWHAIRAR